MDGGSLEGATLTTCTFTDTHINDGNLQNMKATDTNFYRSHLKTALLISSEFKDCSFERSELQGAYINETSLLDCNLEGTKLESANMQDADLTGCKLFQATHTLSNIEYAKLDDIHRYEDEGRYFEAEVVYRNLKKTLRWNHVLFVASDFSHKESVMQRKQHYANKEMAMWFLYLIADAVCGYGEKVPQIFKFGFVAILAFSLIYNVGDGIADSDEDRDRDAQFKDHLYFSLTTFFGANNYSGFTPRSKMWEILSASETVMGVLLIALLLVTMNRKMVT